MIHDDGGVLNIDQSFLDEQTDIERQENEIIDGLRTRFPDYTILRQFSFTPNGGLGIRVSSQNNLSTNLNIALNRYGRCVHVKTLRVDDYVYYEIVEKK